MFWSKKGKKDRLEELLVISSQMDGRGNVALQILKKMDELTGLLKRLDEKVDTLLESLEKSRKASPVEKRRKEEILSLLQRESALSIYKLSRLMGLSRTRCNELLKSLEDEGLVESIKVGKRKIYRLASGLEMSETQQA